MIISAGVYDLHCSLLLVTEFRYPRKNREDISTGTNETIVYNIVRQSQRKLPQIYIYTVAHIVK